MGCSNGKSAGTTDVSWFTIVSFYSGFKDPWNKGTNWCQFLCKSRTFAWANMLNSSTVKGELFSRELFYFVTDSVVWLKRDRGLEECVRSARSCNWVMETVQVVSVAVWENSSGVTVVHFGRQKKNKRNWYSDGFGKNGVFLTVSYFETSALRSHKYISGDWENERFLFIIYHKSCLGYPPAEIMLGQEWD